jgi:hypothetical protein
VNRPPLINALPPVTDADIDAVMTRAVPVSGVSGFGVSPMPSEHGPTADVPFPTDALPGPVARFIAEQGAAIGCDDAFIALPVLATLAGAVGNAVAVQPKRGYREPIALWGVVVSESGSGKSPAMAAALAPLRARQQRALSDHARAMTEHAAEVARWEAESVAFKRGGGSGQPPERPLEPVADRMLADDLTIEAAGALLAKQPRGLLIARDELSGWFGSFDAYRAGKGGDEAKWLEMHSGRPLVIDRKGSGVLAIPAALVSIVGGVQPGVLRRMSTHRNREGGLLARFTFAFPPRRPILWSDAEPDPGTVAVYAGIVDALADLPLVLDEQGEPQPRLLTLSPDARDRHVAAHNALTEEATQASADLSAAFTKLRATALRLAGLVHLVRLVTLEPGLDSERIDDASMAAAWRLVSWFKGEAAKVLDLLVEGDEDAAERNLVRWVQGAGGRCTLRTLCKGLSAFKRNPEGAQAALDRLVAQGVGRWESVGPGPRGGRPTVEFVLNTPSAKPETPETP